MAGAKRPRVVSESSRQSLHSLFIFIFIFIFRQAFAVERLVGRSERIRERGKRRMTGRGTDLDAALNGGRLNPNFSQ